MISPKEVQHIAKLARIGIAKKEEGKFRQDLSSILDYVAKLEKVAIVDTAATSHPFALQNVVRADEAEKKTKNLMGLAPETEDNYIKVRSILR